MGKGKCEKLSWKWLMIILIFILKNSFSITFNQGHKHGMIRWPKFKPESNTFKFFAFYIWILLLFVELLKHEHKKTDLSELWTFLFLLWAINIWGSCDHILVIVHSIMITNQIWKATFFWYKFEVDMVWIWTVRRKSAIWLLL